MLPFIVRRMLWMVVLPLVISFLTFVIFYTLPAADPAALRAGRQPTAELLESIRHTLGLDKPWYIQYLKYLDRLVFHFDFGYSFQNNVSVRAQISDRLPGTATLALGGAIVWRCAGIGVGIVSAIRRGRWMDRVAMGGALVAISASVYWLGLVSLYLFSEDLGKLRLFPGQGAYARSRRDELAAVAHASAGPPRARVSTCSAHSSSAARSAERSTPRSRSSGC
jgi:peptide/nickel transport system permease protein